MPILEYNAMKTASIVTPITGEIRMTAIYDDIQRDSITISLGWREGKWEFNNIKGTVDSGTMKWSIEIQNLGDKPNPDVGKLWSDVGLRLQKALSNQ